MAERALIEALRDPGAYPWPVDAVDVVETHISWVFLAGDRVIKVKRPVRYSFVDYSTLEKRHAACQDEIRLNSLLSDGVYLDAVRSRARVAGAAWATKASPSNGRR